MPTLKVISLGCSKNTVDSEIIMGNAESSHWSLFPSDSLKNPDVLLINTCGFIGDAKNESIEMILRAVGLKISHKIHKLYVMGCLVERHGKELAQEIEEVDAWFGANKIEEVIHAIIEENIEVNLQDRELTTPSHYAYLKISEGCDRRCSFCAIPLIRGKHISRSIEDIVSEARALVHLGVKELIIIAQDVTYYGVDLYGERRISSLLQELLKIENLEWIRLQYLYPHGFPEDLIALMQREPKICKYIDIPLQHISSSVLDSMKRTSTKEQTEELLHKLRKALPNAAFRTTLIVGYPNETEADFEALKQFVREFRFERLGVFMYSAEEGTSAWDLGDKVSEDLKNHRADEIMELQESISYDINSSKIGKIYKVIIDRKEGDYYVGRTEYDSPEVDDEVLIPLEEKGLKIGEFYSVKITEAEAHDLYATTSVQ
ncbi:MAG: 30S ribosomal protein S12 methylthiotransferase RimO [Bacteroidales bacterium]